MRCTSGWRTTSSALKNVKATPSTPRSTSIAWRRPERCWRGRSICVMSPVTTALEPKPRRVRNIFICSTEVFCASSRMMKESLSERPRMNASGATSMTWRSMLRATRSKPIISYSASYIGRRYGSTFCAMSPGRKPSRSPASTAGRTSTMRRTLPECSASTALATARYVLPVPAGPMPNVRSLTRTWSRYCRWFGPRPRMPPRCVWTTVSLPAGSVRRRARGKPNSCTHRCTRSGDSVSLADELEHALQHRDGVGHGRVGPSTCTS